MASRPNLVSNFRSMSTLESSVWTLRTSDSASLIRRAPAARRPVSGGRVVATARYLFNRKARTICDRTAYEWALRISFYFIFYSFLLFVTWCGYTAYSPNDDFPEMTGNRSRLGYHKLVPGMGFRPHPDYQSNLIRFVSGFPETYRPYTDQLDAVLVRYRKSEQMEALQCGPGEEQWSRPTDRRGCFFDTIQLGDRCHFRNEYGFRRGRPCILLTLNRIVDWIPEIYDDGAQLPGDVHWSPHHIPVSCSGRTVVDQENMGDVLFHPAEGFPIYFYPFHTQESYRSPLVFAEFLNLTSGVAVTIECKAWAKNIPHENYGVIDDMMTGSVRFTILLD